jgi:D-xylose transport system substrate-binding protein
MTVRTGLMIVSLLVSVAIGTMRAHSNHAAVAANAQPVIGMSLDTLKEPRWQADSDLFKKRAEELGARVLIQAANGQDTQQINDVQSLLSDHLDVLVIVPHDGAAMAKGVQLAHDAGVPVIAYDRLIKNCDLDLYMSFDNVKVGRLQAQWLIDHFPTPGHGRIVRVSGSKTDNNAFLFKQGQDEVLKPYIDRGDVKIVWDDWADDWKLDNAKRITNAAITALGRNGFDAVLATADTLAGGAVQALEEEGIAGRVLVTGQDADLVACQRIVSGTQSMTVYKPLKRLATSAAEIAVKLAHRKVVTANQMVNNGQIDVPSILADIYAVDKGNMMQTVIADGFHTKEEVYGAGK